MCRPRTTGGGHRSVRPAAWHLFYKPQSGPGRIADPYIVSCLRRGAGSNSISRAPGLVRLALLEDSDAVAGSTEAQLFEAHGRTFKLSDGEAIQLESSEDRLSSYNAVSLN
ncbi:hypothetical protein TKK_0002984 [Trichogramma kaykai]